MSTILFYSEKADNKDKRARVYKADMISEDNLRDAMDSGMNWVCTLPECNDWIDIYAYNSNLGLLAKMLNHELGIIDKRAMINYCESFIGDVWYCMGNTENGFYKSIDYITLIDSYLGGWHYVSTSSSCQFYITTSLRDQSYFDVLKGLLALMERG
jgi:hypothetical protein